MRRTRRASVHGDSAPWFIILWPIDAKPEEQSGNGEHRKSPEADPDQNKNDRLHKSNVNRRAVRVNTQGKIRSSFPHPILPK